MRLCKQIRQNAAAALPAAGKQPPPPPARRWWSGLPAPESGPPHHPAMQDLLPGEIASKRKPGPAPMRAPAAGSTPTQQPPSAPAVVTSLPARPLSQSTSPGPADSSVDGVPDSKVDAWFQLADADGDGRVADSEARDFFLTSGLAPADLSKVWAPAAGRFCCI